MLPYFYYDYGNPSSIHPLGRRAREAVERAREQVAQLINCQPNEVIFTSGGTEADNLAILGVAGANVSKGRHVITSQIEHHAVLEACRNLERNGFEVTYLEVDPFGIVAPENVRDAIRPDTILVSIMTANNVIGTIEPVAEIGAICQKLGVLFHTDAVQAVGHLPIDVERSDIDLMSLSAHKFYGPKGVGALYARGSVALSPIIFGGGQEEGLRSGTENVPAIVGMGAAAEIARYESAGEEFCLRKMSRDLIAGIMTSVPGSRLNGHPDKRLPGNVNVSIEGMEGEYLSGELAKRGICVSTGSACSSATHEAPYVLLATGLDRDLANCSIRLSLGKHTTDEDIKRAVQTLSEIVQKVRAESEVYSRW
ncbi:Cysteine sulfinate desulfinase/cysteine desulfurase or related enzyme [Dehalogenimonas alkenigignens]|nr:Cysteine sulfinate desulfinase/cysteine desulfurase or related enzyme [Dehalogenimonas alkenigignens]